MRGTEKRQNGKLTDINMSTCKTSKSYKVCKTALYSWNYDIACLKNLHASGISKRRYKKFYFRILSEFYSVQYIHLCWRANIKLLG